MQAMSDVWNKPIDTYFQYLIIKSQKFQLLKISCYNMFYHI